MRNKPYPFYEWDQAENIWHLLDLAAKKYGDKDAYVFKQGKEDVHKTFRDFHREAHALAAWFAGEGYTRQRIAILGENSYDWIVAWFGVVLSNNIAVPVDKLLQPEQVAFILSDTQSAALVYSRQCEELAPAFMETAGGKPLAKIRMGEELAFRVEQGAALLKARGETAVPNHTDKDALCLIIYTSGTTGIAKGVALTQDNLCFDMNSLTKIVYYPGHNLFVLPMNHVYAFTGLLLFLLEGVTTCISAGLKRVSKEMKEYAPYTMLLVPLFLETIYGKIMDNARRQGMEKKLRMLMKASLALYAAGIDIRRKLFKRVLAEFGGNLSVVVSGGAPIDQEYIKAFRALGITVLNGYGITECSPCLTGNRNNHYRDGSVGQAIPGAEMKTDAPDGKSEGELYARGRMVMKEYYNNEQATRDVFDGDWFKTGDYGYIDEDGFIFITGRKKNIIILSNGKNLYPEELELQLMKIPAISEVVVYEELKQVAAEIFPNADWLADNGVDVDDIKAHIEAAIEKLNNRLPPYKNIAKINFRATGFPKTSSQKIRRNKP